LADRLNLSLWFPSFREGEMMPRALSVLRQFPFSASRPGIGFVAVHAVNWNEPLVFQQTFDFRADSERAIALASEFLHSDYAYEFEVLWDLWAPEIEGDLDARWVLQPHQVRVRVHGTDFDEGTYQENGHIQVEFGLDTPFLHEEMELDDVSEARVKTNVKKLVDFTSAIEKNCGISGRLLWSDSEEAENLAQKLISRLQRVQ
jgi:hypothetical protein